MGRTSVSFEKTRGVVDAQKKYAPFDASGVVNIFHSTDDDEKFSQL
jgi:hypothetical protein